MIEFDVIDLKTDSFADVYDIALKEDWAKGLCYCDMEGFSLSETGGLYLADECGKCVCCPGGRFKVILYEVSGNARIYITDFVYGEREEPATANVELQELFDKIDNKMTYIGDSHIMGFITAQQIKEIFQNYGVGVDKCQEK